MSLAIDTEDIEAVLLIDGWHRVKPGTFDLDAYEFVEQRGSREPQLLHGGGKSGVCATGFDFIEIEQVDGHDIESSVCGPLTAILAVRRKPSA